MLADLFLSASFALFTMSVAAFLGLSIGGAVLVGIMAFAGGLAGAAGE